MNPISIILRRHRDLLAEAKRLAGPVDHAAATDRDLPAAERAFQRDQVPTYRTLRDMERAEHWRRDAYLTDEILARARVEGW